VTYKTSSAILHVEICRHEKGGSYPERILEKLRLRGQGGLWRTNVTILTRKRVQASSEGRTAKLNTVDFVRGWSCFKGVEEAATPMIWWAADTWGAIEHE